MWPGPARLRPGGLVAAEPRVTAWPLGGQPDAPSLSCKWIAGGWGAGSPPGVTPAAASMIAGRAASRSWTPTQSDMPMRLRHSLRLRPTSSTPWLRACSTSCWANSRSTLQARGGSSNGVPVGGSDDGDVDESVTCCPFSPSETLSLSGQTSYTVHMTLPTCPLDTDPAYNAGHGGAEAPFRAGAVRLGPSALCAGAQPASVTSCCRNTGVAAAAS